MLFGDYGDVENVTIWADYENSSTRFAIVEMENDDEAKRAIRKLDGAKVSRKRRLWVEPAPDAFRQIVPGMCGRRE
jgi:RNA recognition motif-containing protein